MRAEVRIAQTQRPEVMRIFRDFLGRITGVVDQDLLGQDHRVDSMPKRLNLERAHPDPKTSSDSAKRDCRPNRRGTCIPNTDSKH